MAFRIVNLADEATGRALHAAADQAAGDIELSIEAADADVLVCTVSDSRTLAAVTDARRHSPDAQIVLRVPDDEADRVRARVSFVPGMAGAWVVPASSTPAALADVLRKAASISVRRRRVRALRKHINQQLARNGEADAHGAECPREQQLERSASYLPTLFAQAPQAFVAITPEGDVTAWNQAAERICGVSAHAAVGRPIAQVLPPAAAQALLELAQRTIGHDAVSAQEMKLALAPATIWAQVNATPVRSGEDLLCVSVTIRDVSERHAMIGRVRASELRYRTLTETLPQLIWTTDRDGNAVYYNRQWLEYTGAEAASHAGHGWLDAVTRTTAHSPPPRGAAPSPGSIRTTWNTACAERTAATAGSRPAVRRSAMKKAGSPNGSAPPPTSTTSCARERCSSATPPSSRRPWRGKPGAAPPRRQRCTASGKWKPSAT